MSNQTGGDAAEYRVRDPQTDAQALFEICSQRPDLRPQVALHPNAYQGLLEWLEALDDPQVAAALQARQRGVECGDDGLLPLATALHSTPAAATDATEAMPQVQAETPAETSQYSDDAQYGQSAQYDQSAQYGQSAQYDAAAQYGQPAQYAAGGQYAAGNQYGAQLSQYAQQPQGYPPQSYQGHYAGAASQQQPKKKSSTLTAVLIGAGIGLVVLAGLVVAALWFSGDNEVQQARPSHTPIAATKTPPSSTPPTSATPSETPTEETVDKSAYLPNATAVSHLAAPSGNIACATTGDGGWKCSIFQHDFTDALGTTCATDTPVTVAYDAQGVQSVSCGSDLSAGGATEVPYGETVQLEGSAGCTSTEGGMRCWDGATNTGVNLARAGISDITGP